MLGQLDDALNDALEAFVAELHGAQHDLFRQLLRLGLDHQHALGRAGDDEVELAELTLRGRGVQHVATIDPGHARAGNRAHERNARDGQRGRTADQRHDVGVVLQVVAQHGGDDLHLIAEAGREQRTQRAVDQARDQRFALARPALALEEAAGDLASRERLFLVVHRQREEILAGLDRTGADHGAEHNGVAQTRQHSAIGLASDLTCFKRKELAAPGNILAEILVEHASSYRVGRRAGSQAPAALALGISGHVVRMGPTLVMARG